MLLQKTIMVNISKWIYIKFNNRLKRIVLESLYKFYKAINVGRYFNYYNFICLGYSYI